MHHNKHSAIIHVKDFSPQRVDSCAIFSLFICGDLNGSVEGFFIIPSL
nr:MAG TPA: hypothetical protein [Caudoviricetes sp.]DAM72631.1 MAG TPA: hypothetical protein [Caudoviricetes sp.]DAV56115.1 MAG TPA: hypothetical protein [Caudoviricetes sp.]